MSEPLRVLDLFSGGMGGFSLGLERTGGFETVALCEINPDNRRMLKANWPHVPCYEDVRSVSAETLRADGIARVDVIAGGFPCQDASVANVRGLGTAGARTGLFVEVVRLARELGPRFIIMENVPGLLGRGFGDVLGCLAESGFDAEWDCIRARHLGADHERERLCLVAYPNSEGRQGSQPHHGVLVRTKAALSKLGDEAFGEWRALVGGERLVRSGDGLSVGMERRRLYAAGNAVVPQIPELIGRAILAAEAERQAA